MLRGLIHRAVLGSRDWPVLGGAYRAVYRSAADSAARSLAAEPGVRSVILHRGMTREGWEPGVSDIDLLVVRQPGADEPALLDSLSRRVGGLRRRYPMLGDLWMGTGREVGSYLRWGGLRSWEDSPDWNTIHGRPETNPGTSESLEKRRLLDPWVWAFISHVELGRRAFRFGREPGPKRAADARKLSAEVRRLTRFIKDDNAERPLRRSEELVRSPGAGGLWEAWISSSLSLAGASRAVLDRVAVGRSKAAVPIPRPDGSRKGVSAILKACPPALACVSDPPYHTYLIVPEDASRKDYERIVGDLPKTTAGVPVVLTPSAWALLLQSSYLGGPLGWLGSGNAAGTGPPRGLFADWRTEAAGDVPRVPLLPRQLRWEIAAEAASWMALWRRPLWMDPGWGSGFVLFHLYTRALALRLTLDEEESGPFCGFAELIRRSMARYPEERPFLESLEHFNLEEPAECVDALPRSQLDPGLAAGLDHLMGGVQDLLDPKEEAACLAR